MKTGIDKGDWPVVYDGRRGLRGEAGKDLVKLPVYEIEKQVLLSGRSVRPPAAGGAPFRSRGAAGGPGRHRRPRFGSSGWSTGRHRRQRYRE